MSAGESIIIGKFKDGGTVRTDYENLVGNVTLGKKDHEIEYQGLPPLKTIEERRHEIIEKMGLYKGINDGSEGGVRTSDDPNGFTSPKDEEWEKAWQQRFLEAAADKTGKTQSALIKERNTFYNAKSGAGTKKETSELIDAAMEDLLCEEGPWPRGDTESTATAANSSAEAFDFMAWKEEQKKKVEERAQEADDASNDDTVLPFHCFSRHCFKRAHNTGGRNVLFGEYCNKNWLQEDLEASFLYDVLKLEPKDLTENTQRVIDISKRYVDAEVVKEGDEPSRVLITEEAEKGLDPNFVGGLKRTYYTLAKGGEGDGQWFWCGASDEYKRMANLDPNRDSGVDIAKEAAKWAELKVYEYLMGGDAKTMNEEEFENLKGAFEKILAEKKDTYEQLKRSMGSMYVLNEGWTPGWRGVPGQHETYALPCEEKTPGKGEAGCSFKLYSKEKKDTPAAAAFAAAAAGEVGEGDDDDDDDDDDDESPPPGGFGGGGKRVRKSLEGGRKRVRHSLKGGRRRVRKSLKGGRRRVRKSLKGGRRRVRKSLKGGRRRRNSSYRKRR